MIDILYTNPEESLLRRLLHVRGIHEDIDKFLSPSVTRDWHDPFLLHDISIGATRIVKAIEAKERIMIFGDYDVDGMTSSSILYLFIKYCIGYNNISIRLPHRIHDGYGIRKHHIDEMAACSVGLIITVDNGITAVREAEYAIEKGIDVVITDHHTALSEIPQAKAVINPQISPNYPFKEIAGATVALKVTCALSQYLGLSSNKSKKYFDLLLPYAAIGTIADCCPLINENRAIVSEGLGMINTGKISRTLRRFLKKIGLPSNARASHIGFIVGPKLNASGRVGSPYEGLSALLSLDSEKQEQYVAQLEQRNTQRRQLQDKLVSLAEGIIDIEKPILIAVHEKFHDGLIGIVAGRLCEKYNKPTIIIAKRDDHLVGSVRAPEYFSVIAMLESCNYLLSRYGGHAVAGGLTCDISNELALVEALYQYGDQSIDIQQSKKKITVDTIVYDQEIQDNSIEDIIQLAPFGEANPEPKVLIPNIKIRDIIKVGKRGNGHAKISALHGTTPLSIMMRGKGAEIDALQREEYTGCVGSIKPDSYNGGYFIDGTMLLDSQSEKNFFDK